MARDGGWGSAHADNFMPVSVRPVLSTGGIALATLGFVVLAGWLLGAERVTAIIPWLDPMPFNTALTFVLLGMALLALAAGRRTLARVGAGLAALFGCLTILQHALDTSLLLDALFFTPGDHAPAGFHGRASPNAGLAFLLTGLSILALTRERGVTTVVGGALLAATALTIALVDLLAYPLSLGGHTAPILPQMALHSAAGLVLVGAILELVVWRLPGGPGESRHARISLAVGVGVALLGVLMVQLLRNQERKQIRGMVRVAAQSVADRLARNLEARVTAMRSLAQTWSAVPPGGWDVVARAVLDGASSQRALAWVNQSGSARWLALAPGEAGLRTAPWWPDSAIRASALADQPVQALRRVDSRLWLGLLTPAQTADRQRGFIWVLTDLSQTIGNELQSLSAQFSVSVRDGDRELYHVGQADGSELLWSSIADVSSGGMHWRVTLAPTEAALADARSALPILTLSAAMLVAVLLGLSYALARAARQRAGDIEAAHSRLTAETREREAAEAALRRSQEQLGQAQKLEAVGRLAGGIAHDYNNILTVIRGNARSLLVQDSLAGLSRDALEHIDRAAVRGTLLTARLLAFSQRQLLQPETLSLGQLVLALRDELTALLGPHIRLTLEPHAQPDEVLVDRRWMSQVILDLGFNARESMPLGGTLSIGTRVADDALRTGYGVTQLTGAAVVLEIEDSGQGMDETTKGRLFEPFFSTKKFGQGAGLALASAYGIVRQSGGEIAVRSIPGRGTLVGIFLPAAPAERDAVAPPITLPGRVVLAAEDEVGVLRFIQRTLEAAGCRVIAGASAEEVLAALAESAALPDLLVSDIVMPGRSGVELAEAVRRLHGGVALLLVSAYTSDALKERGIESLGAYLLQKPFTADELLQQVARALARPLNPPPSTSTPVAP